MSGFRPMDAELEGYSWLPRMIDKSRAARAGTLNDLVHPCPIDGLCLERLGLDVEEFGDVVAANPDDASVLAALRARGIASAQEAWFDAEEIERGLRGGRAGVADPAGAEEGPRAGRVSP
ncbi:MAG: DUF5069 domain-containing protein [Thermoleophilia bacterium]|nr:DUF5069 domain-containing protein [Thermoleophilia bacterium]